MNELTGWYYIDEMWNLYINGNLQKVHVDFIQVDEKPNSSDFIVNHYDRSGEIITTVTLEESDISWLENEETTDRPWHI